MKSKLLIVIGLMILIPVTFAEESKTFVIDGYTITTNHNLLDISLNWDKLDGSITLSEPFTGTVEIQIPKSMPRLTNLDFGTSLHAIQTDGTWIEIKETESQCFYHLEIPVNNSDYVEIVGASAAAGNWELVSKSNPVCDAQLDVIKTNEEKSPTPEPEELEPAEEPICGPNTFVYDGNCVRNDGPCQLDMNGDLFCVTQNDCLIATASYGSELAPQVQMLREVRDNTLLTTESGKIFMDGFNSIYYSFSPQIAQLENENPMFRDVVKVFITPMIATLSIMTLAQENSEFDAIFLGIPTIGLILGMYVVSPIVLVWKIRKRK